MRSILGMILLGFIVQSCNEKVENSSVVKENWKERTIERGLSDSLLNGSTYLSVYSQIYSQSEHRTHDLTATISMRNTDQQDTIFISSTEYFNTKGKLIRKYFSNPIFIAPMETVEIVINEQDEEGGTGGNFMFNWSAKPSSNKPMFDAVMISTSGQQGLSFTTQGQIVK